MIHDYTTDKPSFVQVKEGHYIYANQKEIKEYQNELKGRKGI